MRFVWLVLLHWLVCTVWYLQQISSAHCHSNRFESNWVGDFSLRLMILFKRLSSKESHHGF